jgi:hypothetical protein
MQNLPTREGGKSIAPENQIPIEKSSAHFETMAAGTKAGKEALQLLLDRFYM